MEWTRSSSGSATPSFSSKHGNPERVGRDGFLKLCFARSGQNTILARSCFSLPLETLAPLTLADGASYLMLLNPTGGVLGGDHLVTEIVLEQAAHVCLTTPSATRVYRTAGGPAILETVIRVGEDATLEYLPDHLIPHGGSFLRQSLRVELARGSRAILLDSMACGRVAHGEQWKFLEIDARTEVVLCGGAAYINRTRIIPGVKRPDEPGLMEGFDYMTCLCVFADGFTRWTEVCTALNAEINALPGIRGGASTLPRGGCVARFLAPTAPDMTQGNQKLCDAARELVAALPRFDHRKY